jgi:cardiolipin synthase
VVDDLQRTFATDWAFAAGEQLRGPTWFAPTAPHGTVAARGIPDGPDHHLDNMLQVLLGALAVARSRVRIVTPYFLPDDVLLTAVKVTALRGVAVDVVLPVQTNIPVIDWAMRPQLADLIERGCRVHLTPPLFDHTKLMRVDDLWSLIGSTNWDARSLRLNFEYNLECYDADLARRLDALIDAKIATAHRPSAAEVHALPFAVRLRNGLARMLSPYL